MNIILKMADEIDGLHEILERLKRENAILRQHLKKYMVDELQMYGRDITDKEADAQAEKEITWLVLHNEGAE